MPDQQNPATILQHARQMTGFSVRKLAGLVKTNVASLSKIERGLIAPRKPVARALYEFYGGSVSLGEIYDPTHPCHEKQLDQGRQRRVRELAGAPPA